MTTPRDAGPAPSGDRPFSRIDWVLVIAFALAVLSSGYLWWMLDRFDTDLKHETGFGIVALELAGRAERASQILLAWSDPAGTTTAVDQAPTHAGSQIRVTLRDRLVSCPDSRLDCALTSLRWDFVFILYYTSTILLAIYWTFRLLHIQWDGLRWLFALPILAAVLDISENLALSSLIEGFLGGEGVHQASVTIATAAAMVKFLLLGLSLLTLASTIGLWSLSWPWRTDRPRRARLLIKPFEMVMRNERRYLRGRRRLAGMTSEQELARPPLGVSLSGGGIRSAVVGLGLLQSLMRHDLGRQIDYLSSVSGGGYIATTLSSLLSMRQVHSGPAPVGEGQLVFDVGVSPQFAVSGPNTPFADPKRVCSKRSDRWLTGEMVVTHLRAFGDFLARRQRLLDRDLLRAVGSISAGITASLLLYTVLLLLISGLLLTLVHLNQPLPPAGVPTGFSGDLGWLWEGMGFQGYLGWLWESIGWARFTGVAVAAALLMLGLSITTSLIQQRGPQAWDRRDGDTPQETRQYRLLWVVGVLVLASGLLLGRPVASQSGVAPSLLFPVAFFLGCTLAAGLAHLVLVARGRQSGFFRTNLQRRSFVAAALTLGGVMLLLAIGLALLPWVLGVMAEQLRGGELGHPALASLGGGATMGLVAWLNARRHKLQSVVGETRSVMEQLKALSEPLLRLILGVAVTVFLIASLILALWSFGAGLEWLSKGTPVSWPLVFLATLIPAVLFILLGLVIDFNKLSLHYFYRDRLVEAFLRTEARPTGVYGRHLELKRDHESMRLTDLHGVAGDTWPTPRVRESFLQYTLVEPGQDTGQRSRRQPPRGLKLTRFRGAVTAAPYHLYVTSVNLATERDMHFRSRKSEVFVFSKLYCGSSVTGYVDTGVYRAGDTKVARVMTISGAALDSALGRETFFAQSFAATLLNIRLGQWLENPAFQSGRHLDRQENGVFWPVYMIMEALGLSDSHHRLIHLSDGGHSGDNLGLIPLLQRRCRLILTMDAEHDPEYRFQSLAHALRYASVDLGIEVDLELDSLRPQASGHAARHFAIGRIHYPAAAGQPALDGWLVVLKASLIKADPVTLQTFKGLHPDFPQQGTTDQFFSEDQFEAYRQLGQAMADELLQAHPELVGGELKV